MNIEGGTLSDTILHVLTSMQDQLNRIEGRLDSLVPRPEYEAWKVHAEAAHVRIEAALQVNAAAIEAVDMRIQANERDRMSWARDVNLRVWLAIGTALMGMATAFVLRAVG